MCRGGEDGRAGEHAGIDEQLNAAKRGEAEPRGRKKSVPCPKGKLLKLGIGAFKADTTWITELLSHRICENHAALQVNPVIVKSAGILWGSRLLLKKFEACCIDRAAV